MKKIKKDRKKKNSYREVIKKVSVNYVLLENSMSHNYIDLVMITNCSLGAQLYSRIYLLDEI